MRATSSPNTFVFSELLLTPQIQALSSSPEHAPYLDLLKIFCYGTYTTYKSSSNLPVLNAAQMLKLRQISLLTLARRPENLTYDCLISTLGLEDSQALENLVISAIYAGLIIGTLDPHHQRVCISSIAPLRDVAPTSIPALVDTLKEWSSRCSSTLSALELQIAKIKSDALKRHKDETEWDAEIEQMIEAEGQTGKANEGKKLGNTATIGRRGDKLGAVKRGFFGGSTNTEEGDMDIDEEEEDGERKGLGVRSLKKRGLGL
jgi:COP9 signalosome complex subunit 7